MLRICPLRAGGLSYRLRRYTPIPTVPWGPSAALTGSPWRTALRASPPEPGMARGVSKRSAPGAPSSPFRTTLFGSGSQCLRGFMLSGDAGDSVASCS